MNTFMNQLNNNTNYKYTENCALAYKSLNNPVYNMFAFGAAYRQRDDADCILLFKNAFEEDPDLALKCLFYLRDCRGGQGERRFFRICYKWFAKTYPMTAINNLVCSGSFPNLSLISPAIALSSSRPFAAKILRLIVTRTDS